MLTIYEIEDEESEIKQQVQGNLFRFSFVNDTSVVDLIFTAQSSIHIYVIFMLFLK